MRTLTEAWRTITGRRLTKRVLCSGGARHTVGQHAKRKGLGEDHVWSPVSVQFNLPNSRWMVILRWLLQEQCKGEDMPIYEYRCEKCGQLNEFLILGTQNRLQCEQCGSDELTKLMSAHNTSTGSSRKVTEPGSGGCCGTPHSCGTPGSCCSG